MFHIFIIYNNWLLNTNYFADDIDIQTTEVKNFIKHIILYVAEVSFFAVDFMHILCAKNVALVPQNFNFFAAENHGL